jgi:glutaredoxin-like protein NrdH
MQKPIEGVDDVNFGALNKGGGSQSQSNRAQQKPNQATRKHKKLHTATRGNQRQQKRPNLRKTSCSARLILTRKFRLASEIMPFSKVQGKKTIHKVVVYALSTCVWCKMTKQFLKDNEIEFEYIDVDMCEPQEKEKVRQQILSKGGNLSYPTIVVDNTLITGFRKDKLKETLGI